MATTVSRADAQQPIVSTSTTPASSAPTTPPVAARRDWQPVVSPDIAPDGHVTFRLYAPDLQQVDLGGDFGNYHMVKDPDTGVWSVTVGPLAPNIYGYGFYFDGLNIADPSNPHWKPARYVGTSVLEIPGPTSIPYDVVPGVPQGTVTLIDYQSKELGLRRLRVYTPAAYAQHPRWRFPVLYLLHGSGDNESTWFEFGKANVIFDNMIAAGTVKPMIVVTTDGHAVPWDDQSVRGSNLDAFQQDLLENVVPLVDARFRTKRDRYHRAIAGLSMGGEQSLAIGLNHRELFAWVIGMSSATPSEDTMSPFLSNLAEGDRLYPMRLLRITEGDDFLLSQNRAFDALLTSKGVKHEYVETPGGHSWTVWRQDLVTFAPSLF